MLWFTGLSGSGKSTIAQAVARGLTERGKSVLILDGDAVRGTLHRDLKFSSDDILENNRRLAALCSEALGKYDYVLVPVISPFRRGREYARRLLEPHFAELYVKASIEECIRRDVKGLYKKALAGQVENFIGLSLETPYEAPSSPNLTLDTAGEDVSASAAKVLEFVEKRTEKA
ncbi:MAG: adenylyl-sulfate kinase [Elusimicrobia bacterium]|nr:adenylyl-sulfate kinase [Elusimicrobiota bacterium]